MGTDKNPGWGSRDFSVSAISINGRYFTKQLLHSAKRQPEAAIRAAIETVIEAAKSKKTLKGDPALRGSATADKTKTSGYGLQDPG